MVSCAALLLAVALKCILQCGGDSIGELPHCENEIENVMKHKCYDNRILGGTQVKRAPLKWNVIDSSMGRVKVEFPLHRKICTEYLATLSVYEDQNITEDECSKPRNISYCKAHSYRYLSQIKNRAAFGDDPPICTETGSVTFNYIYTGCYTLQVGCVNISERHIVYEGNYLETDYQKDKPSYNVRVSFQNFPATLEGDIDIDFDNILEDIGFKVILMYHEEEVPDLCYKTGLPHTCCAVMNEEIECSAKVQNRLKPQCYRDNTSIKCVVRNITEGHYCIMLEMFDDRCRAPVESVWQFNKCYYHSRVEKVLTPPVSDMSTVVEPVSSDYIVTGIVSLIFIVLCIGVLLYIRMKRIYVRNPENKTVDYKCLYLIYSEKDSNGQANCLLPSRAVNGSALSITQKFQILLLYPRDCELLMKVMATFREVLKERTQCEVYDVFDEQQMAAAARNASCWILKYIGNPNVKVIVLESECSSVIQNAYLQNIRVVYKEPTWMDDLFRLGLAALIKDCDKTTMYRKVFVIRFHGFNAQNDMLRFLVPNIRYTIPQHLNNLRSGLFENQNVLRYDVFLDDSSELEHRLKGEIQNLTNFKSNNPAYLETLLGVR